MANVPITLTVNGITTTKTVEPRTLLVHHLREALYLTGTHFGCDTSQCGASTVHVNGEAVKSCTMFAVQVNGTSITTIEGIGEIGHLHPLQQGFWEMHGAQCGYCTPGMIMSAADLLTHKPNRGGKRPGLVGNFCRCMGYHNIIRAVQYAADHMSPHKELAQAADD